MSGSVCRYSQKSACNPGRRPFGGRIGRDRCDRGCIIVSHLFCWPHQITLSRHPSDTPQKIPSLDRDQGTTMHSVPMCESRRIIWNRANAQETEEVFLSDYRPTVQGYDLSRRRFGSWVVGVPAELVASCLFGSDKSSEHIQCGQVCKAGKLARGGCEHPFMASLLS